MTRRLWSVTGWPLAILAALLVVSVAAGDGIGGRAASMVVLGLAAAKVVVVAAEYVELRHAPPWLIGLTSAWCVGTFTALGVLAAT